MTALGLVIITLTVIGTAIAAVLIAVAVSGLIEARRIRLEPGLGDARRAVITALSGGETKADAVCTGLRGASRRHIVGVMLDLAPSVNGSSRSVLVNLGEKIGVLKRARTGVKRHRWFTRLYSARVLTAFGVESEHQCTLLTDRSPNVRAQAAAWSVIAPTPQAVEQLIGLLEDADGLCRFAAQDALIRIGLPGTEALLGALEGAEAESAGRILTVAAATGDERFAHRAMELTADGCPTTRALAAAVLARTGNPSAGPTLVAMLDDPSDDVVLSAGAAIARLAYWPGAAEVEDLLGHPSWEVRKQAGMTLLALGAPGTILLGVTAKGAGPAADMANQALQLRSLAGEVLAA